MGLRPDALIIVSPTAEDTVNLFLVIAIPGQHSLDLTDGQIREIVDHTLKVAAVPLHVAHDVVDCHAASRQDGSATPALRVTHDLNRRPDRFAG
jgi:hypothetical protein